jgi:4-amino-4-deoxy-L-arabinose transferase-like glycosyltransferase
VERGRPEEPGSRWNRWLRSRLDWVVASLLATLVFFFLLARLDDVGIGRDEALYMVAGETYWHWAEGADFDWRKMRKQSWIDSHYRYNSEHPPFVKHMAGLSWRLFHECDCPTDGRLHWIGRRRHRYDETHSTLGWLSEIEAFRLPTAVLTAVLVAFIYLFGAAAFGRTAGVCAALLYVLMPRVFFHSRLAGLDAPVTAMIFFTVFAYWKALHQARWAVVAGLVFGLALATKLNAFFLPPLFAVHYAWASRDRFRSERGAALGLGVLLPVMLGFAFWGLAERRAAGLGVALVMAAGLFLLRRDALKRPCNAFGLLVPAVFWLQMILGLSVLFVSWPYLWPDPLPRFQGYLNYHLEHVFYNTEYFGINYNLPPFPISFPFVMTAITVPGVTLLLATGGLACTLLAPLREGGDFLRRLIGRAKPGRGGAVRSEASTGGSDRRPDRRPDRRSGRRSGRRGFFRPLAGRRRSEHFLVALFALFPICLIALPSTPIFGGTRTWMPAMPFVALLAGVGLQKVVSVAVERFRLPRWRARLLAGGLVGLAALPGLLQTIHAADLAPSYYTPVVGGTRGAADLGMKRQYWGYASVEVLDYLNETSPDRTPVYWHDTMYLARDLYVRDDMLRRDIAFSGGEYGGIRRSRYALFLYEKHQVMWEFLIWQEYGTFRPQKVLTLDGVPLLNIYGPKGRRLGPPFFRDPSRRRRRR